MDRWAEGAAWLCAQDRDMAAFVASAGPCTLAQRRHGGYFAALARAIVYQQLAIGAAQAIHRRFAALYGDRPSPPAVLATPDEDLRAAGLSGAKVAAIKDLAARVVDGRLRLAGIGRLPDEDVVTRLCTVRGIGPWTAQMFLMFQLTRPDVWPVLDLACGPAGPESTALRQRPAPVSWLSWASGTAPGARWRPGTAGGRWRPGFLPPPQDGRARGVSDRRARIVIDNIRPRTPSGYPAKAVVGEAVRVSADIFKDGHDHLAAQVRWRPSASDKWSTAGLHDLGNDRWEAVIEPSTLGAHQFVVEAWTDRYATWRHKVTTKLAAGQDVAVEMEEGALLFEDRAALEDDQAPYAAVVAALRDESLAATERLAPALTNEAVDLVAGPAGAGDLTSAGPSPLWVDRERALFGAWYELFPRSFGGFAGTAERLPAIADMGFDIVYLPPVHPIGRQYRKGPNNVIEARPDDVGSPWAIGGPEGGHTALHPELGTFDDFDALVHRAQELGMEIALDYALQCSPDHPWVAEHPEWFHHRPDGTIAYAENPPKKYQDIYPINFWPADDADREALWQACRDILDFWIGHGVRVFRVDNPHTKPVAFWDWLIAGVLADYPDVLFLAEAFTRPKVMAKLAEVGFSQSYTYFTWRTAADELREYVEELAHGPTADYMRPNFWPNTPDILSGPLRDGPPAAFRQRLVLAATLVPSYGIYSGYELYENTPASASTEEYLHSEKYELKARDFDDPASLAPLITALNTARRRHPALQRLRTISFHGSNNPDVLAYSKHTDDRSDVVLMVVNLDPYGTAEATLDLDFGMLGLPWDGPVEAFDELTLQTFTWWGNHPYVRLDPFQAAHLLHLRAPK